MSKRYEQLLDILRRATGPITAAEVAARMNVTDRSVRNYVSAINAGAGAPVVLAGPAGYVLGGRGDSGRERFESEATPAVRSARLIRKLVDARAGLDVHETAAALFVSESTLESDLSRIRSRLEGSGLSLQRTGDRVRMLGPETARRRLLSSLFRDESHREMLELEAIQREFPAENLAGFKTSLISALEAEGFSLNEYGLNAVLLHVVIALDRLERQGARIEAGGDAGLSGRSPAHHDIRRILSSQIPAYFATALPEAELDYLAALIATRVITPDLNGRVSVHDYIVPERLRSIREIIERASREYLVDFSDEDFCDRLALHLQNLVNRARDNSYSRNPLTRSMKSSYPMIYEVAVFVASELQAVEGIDIHEDEIAYIAMHLGAQLEQQRRTKELLRVDVVAPAYHELPANLRDGVSAAIAGEAEVGMVHTRTDIDWSRLEADLIVSTIDPPAPNDRIVVVTPFFRDDDVAATRAALARMRRVRRRAQTVRRLWQYFDAELFLRDFPANGPEHMIRALGERLQHKGIITPAYIEGAIERERLSSTAFTESLAVPHAMTMSADRTAIAIAINTKPIAWASSQVQVVAFIAFAESGRATFQEVFDELIEVFADEANVRSLVKNARDFDSFIVELTQLMQA